MPNPGSIFYPVAPATNLKLARPVAYPEISCPIPRVNIPYILRQKFRQWGNSWQPLALGTDYTSADNFTVYSGGAVAFTDYAGFILVEESERSDDGGGFVEWTRTFAKVPARHSEPTTINYNFIAFYPGVSTITNGIPDGGRASFQATAYGEIVYDYAVVDDLADLNSLLPIQSAQYYGYYKTSAPVGAYPSYMTTDQIWAAGRIANVDTYPTLEAYQGLINETPGLENPQIDLDLFPGKDFFLIPIDSQVDVWMGNIMVRKTIFIRPQ